MAPKYAAIDVGTNSTRLLVARVESSRLVPEFFTLRTCRIGEGMSKAEGLQPEPVARTLRVLQEYHQLIRDCGVEKVRVVATSAVREAPNAAEFISRAQRETGFNVEVISGEEEAFLNYLGVCRGLPNLKSGVVVDIGGGSTEFTYLVANSSGTRLCCQSVPLGAVRLTEKPLLLEGILALLKSVLEEIKSLPQKSLVGVGGTITNLAAVDQSLAFYDPEKVHGYYLSADAVTRILFFLAAKNKEERKNVPGLQPERADIIVAGTMILWTILNYLQVPGIVVSEADILHGIIWQLAEGASN